MKATRPTLAVLIDALVEIADTAASKGSLQPGAAYALGALGEACDVGPGCQPEDIARALLGAEIDS